MTNNQHVYVPNKLLTLVLSAVLFLTMLSIAQPANAASSVIVNNVEKIATDNLPVWAQGGWMMKEGNTYYWYGLDISSPGKIIEEVNGVKQLVNNPNAKKKVSAYTSTDLVNWTAHREIVDFSSIETYRAANPDTPVPAFSNNQWFGRPLVHFNNVIDKYVMIMEQGCCGFRNSPSIWYSDTPVGPFTYQKLILNPSGFLGTGDLGSIFTDDDGKTYVSYTIDMDYRSDGKIDYNSGIQISELTTTQNERGEYEIDMTPVVTLESSGPYKEATSVFKIGPKYYMLASQTNGYESSPTYYYTASSISGPWTPADKISTTSWYGTSYPGSSPTGSNSFDTQIDQILPIQGTEGTVYLYIGDRWNNMENNNKNDNPIIRASSGEGRNPFYPLTFNGTGKPLLNGYEKWSIDLAAGTWSATIPDLPTDIDSNVTYAIVNGNSGKALGITGQLTTADATVEQRPFTGAASQFWKFVEAESGYYKIQNTNSGLYMDIKNASLSDGGQSIQWSSSGDHSQQWELVDAGGGNIKIKNRKSGKVLAISGGSTGDGAPVIQWAETGSLNQTWRLDSVAPIDLTKTYYIENRNSGKSIGTVGQSTVDGANIEQRSFTSASSQSWQFEYANGYYKIKNINSGKYMDIAGASLDADANNIIKTASSSASQQWQLVDAGGGYYKLKNVNSGKMLGFSGGSTSDGAINKQWNESSSLNQQWSFNALNP